MLETDAPGCGTLSGSAASVTRSMSGSAASVTRSVVLVQVSRSCVAKPDLCVSICVLGFGFSARMVDRQVDLGILLGMMVALSNSIYSIRKIKVHNWQLRFK
ncbi:hypothetical protein Lalb_Chr14g0367861 [Lupinus albus]|uniref:Uncharacterized protein n=1 Tax=Lupinus albus TaxID=3870 RepID=A0A6A4P9W6_LUPAL|nr:hypothetical protein Lalb_Chr14g0367861 [Lupinus albus]